jgi:hypothetical protein
MTETLTRPAYLPYRAHKVDRAMLNGKVKWFNSQRPHVLVHVSAVERAGLPGLNEGQRVSFDLRGALRPA